MSNIDQFGKDDPEPWKPTDTEYAMYEDIDRTEIKGYGDDDDDDYDDDDDDDDDEKSSVTSSTASSTTTPVTRPKKVKQSKPRKTYTQVLQEDTDFMDEKYTIPKKI